jgi:hypothetical protein
MACLILANGIFLIITHRIYDMGHSNTPAFNWQLITTAPVDRLICSNRCLLRRQVVRAA